MLIPNASAANSRSLLCHVSGNSHQSLEVSSNAVNGHLGHGDWLVGTETCGDGVDNDCDGVIDNGTNAYDDDADGYSENAGDCDDNNVSINPAATESCNGLDDDCDLVADEENASGCTTLYYDYDGDSFGSSSVSGKCLCTADGYYTSSYPTDCYDYNAAANPVAITPSTSSRGDGSYDWNCDGQEVRQDLSAGECNWNFGCDLYTGWQGSAPGCGQSANYVTSCTLACGVFCCNENTVTVTQSCL